MLESSIEKYSKFLVKKPVTFLVVLIVITGILAYGAINIETVDQETQDFLPESFESIKAFNTIKAEFQSIEATSYTILIESQPNHANSNEIRDMRNPRLLRYVKLLDSEVGNIDQVTDVSSPIDLFSDIPFSKAGVNNVLDRLGKERWSSYISDDYTAAKINIKAAGLPSDEGLPLAKDIRYNIESIPKPAGIELTYTGSPYISEAFQNQAGRTSQVTTTVALVLVLVVVIFLFRSLFYGLTSIQTLVFGVAIGLGIFGYLGFNLSPSTSGAISIGVGIAIDFGIQPLIRYKEEREKNEKSIEGALSKSIKGIMRPMTLGLIAAVIGFSTLSFGRITFLSDLGFLLSLTTFIAYVSAFTILPCIIIIYDRYIEQKIPNLGKYFKRR